jgi:MFS family permease
LNVESKPFFQEETKAIISSSSSRKKSRFYYGYYILAACFLIMVVVYGSQISFGVFFKPMLTEFGWTRAETSGPFALCMIVSGVLTIVSGRLSDKFGAKIVVTIGGLIIGVGYLLMSTVSSLWQLYLYFGVLVAAGSSAMYVPVVSLIARWFVKGRGLMSGIGIAGIGFGIGVIPAAASQIIVTYSWRTALVVMGLGSVILLSLIAQLLKDRPAEQLAEKKPSGGVSTLPEPINGISLQEAFKTKKLWMMFIAWIFYGFFFQVGMVHIVPYATDLGLAVVVAASVLTTIGIVGGFGRIVLGLIGDRLGNRRTIYAGFLITGLAYAGLSLSHSVWMLYTFAAIFGALCGVGVLLIPTVAEYFGFKDLGAISGIIVFGNSLGGAISPPLAGAIFDLSGSYQIAFILCGVLAVAAGIIVWLLKPALKMK